MNLFAEFCISIVSSLCFLASPMQPKLEPHSTPLIRHINARKESQKLHVGRREQRSTVTVPQALTNPTEQSEWQPYMSPPGGVTPPRSTYRKPSGQGKSLDVPKAQVLQTPHRIQEDQWGCCRRQGQCCHGPSPATTAIFPSSLSLCITPTDAA